MKTKLHLVALFAVALSGTALAAPPSKTNSFIEVVSREQQANVRNERENRRTGQLTANRPKTIALNVGSRHRTGQAHNPANTYYARMKH